ncbi:MAG TPA: hypothetical protein VH440_00235 [Candidatus Limnocylindrales bacterium]
MGDDLDPGEPGLTRFWIEFDYGPGPRSLSTWNPGPSCLGVTGFDYDDALRIARAEYFADRPLPAVRSFIQDVDVSTIDELMTQPFSPPTWRGVWYPPQWRSRPSVDDSSL